MVVPIVLLAGLAFSAATQDFAFVAVAAVIAVAWHEMLMWDLHGHLYRIEEELSERGWNDHG